MISALVAEGAEPVAGRLAGRRRATAASRSESSGSRSAVAEVVVGQDCSPFVAAECGEVASSGRPGINQGRERALAVIAGEDGRRPRCARRPSR